MKKIFVVALCAMAIFAGAASAEIVEFPSLKIDIDVEEGWEYSDNGTGAAEIEGPDGSLLCITRFGSQGASLDDFVKVLVKEQKGANLKKENSNVYLFTTNGGKTTVMVSKDNTTSTDFVVIETTAKSQKSLDIINKMLASSKDS